jgi:NADH:ubiquinone oxidoreductase subunit 2 (subunit N)
MASETGDSWRLASRTLILLLVASDLVIFEILLHTAAHPLENIGAGSAMLIILAIVLRGGIAPAHVWLPPALPGVSVPTALLLAGVPAGTALIGGQKLLAGAGTETGDFALVIALTAALWSAVGGSAQRAALPTLAYATAASAALLLVALPLGSTAGSSPWLVLSLLACCAATVIVGILHAGPARSSVVVAILTIHGLAAGQAALLAAERLTSVGAFLASLIAVLATLLLTLAVRRTPEHRREDDSGEAAIHALALAALAAFGLGFAWATDGMAFASLWPAPIAISLGLVLFRVLPEREEPRIPPGDILVPAAAAGGRAVRLVAHLCTRSLPRYRDRAQRALIALWNGERWADRIARLESRLGAWSATSLLMLLVAIAGALLLAY